MGKQYSKTDKIEHLCLQPNFQLDYLDCVKRFIRDSPEMNNLLVSSFSLSQSNFCEMREMYDPETNQKFLLKTFNTTLLSTVEREFLLENLRTLQKLEHPGILKIFCIYESTDQFVCAVYDHFIGDQLSSRLVPGQKTLTNIEIFTILEQVVNCLEYLHEQELCYSNFDPSQLLFNGQNIKIHNFEYSLAKNNRDPLNILSLNVEYLSPEILMGEHFERSSDLWAVGVLIYYLFTMEHPFIGKAKSETISNIIQNKPRIPIMHLDLAEEEKEFVAQLLQSDPRNRLTLEKVKIQKYFMDKQIAFENQATSIFKSLLNFESSIGSFGNIRFVFHVLFAVQNKDKEQFSKDVAFLFKKINKSGNGKMTREELLQSTVFSQELKKRFSEMFDEFSECGSFLPFEIFLTLFLRVSSIFSKETLLEFYNSFESQNMQKITKASLQEKINGADIVVQKFLKTPCLEISMDFPNFLESIL